MGFWPSWCWWCVCLFVCWFGLVWFGCLVGWLVVWFGLVGWLVCCGWLLRFWDLRTKAWPFVLIHRRVQQSHRKCPWRIKHFPLVCLLRLSFFFSGLDESNIFPLKCTSSGCLVFFSGLREDRSLFDCSLESFYIIRGKIIPLFLFPSAFRWDYQPLQPAAAEAAAGELKKTSGLAMWWCWVEASFLGSIFVCFCCFFLLFVHMLWSILLEICCLAKSQFLVICSPLLGVNRLRAVFLVFFWTTIGKYTSF